MSKLKELMQGLIHSNNMNTQNLVNQIKIKPVEQVYAEIAEEWETASKIEKADQIIAYIVEKLKSAKFEDQVVLLELLNYATDTKRYY